MKNDSGARPEFVLVEDAGEREGEWVDTLLRQLLNVFVSSPFHMHTTFCFDAMPSFV